MEPRLACGWLSIGVYLGVMLMAIGDVLNLEWFPLFLFFGGLVSGTLNLHVYHNEPEWYFKYHAKQVQKQHEKEVIFE